MQSISQNTVLVAMSGGVDSAVAAYLLKEQGYECTGVMMRLHNMPGIEDDIASFQKICDFLKIEAVVLDLRDIFKQKVMDYFVHAYETGTTPNPCVICNRELKFGALRQHATLNGLHYIATGHYAIIAGNDTNDYKLKCATDTAKDQSYFLNQLTQTDLSRILLPLGKMTKDEVRKIAEQQQLPCAHRPESQDICFVEDGHYREFLQDHGVKNQKAGNIVDTNGQILGKHTGIANYTIGQRKGLGIAMGEPAYVCKIDVNKNQVVLGNREDSQKYRIAVKNFNWQQKWPDKPVFKCAAKLRYRQKITECEVVCEHPEDGLLEIEFKQPQFAPAPGQFAVLYDDDTVIGGGEIF